MNDEPDQDAVMAAFENLREQARKRGGRVPNLPQRTEPKSTAYPEASGEATVPGLELPDVDKRSSFPRGPGRPSGPDGRRRRRPLEVPTVGSIMGKEIVARGWQHELANGWVTGHWDSLVGEQIAAHTTVEMIKGGTVFISCTSTAWATNLKYMQRTILEKIAEKVGPGVITQLKIFGPKAPNWRKGPLHIKGRGPRDTYG